MRRPVIGVSAALERARWTVWDVEANLSPRTYSAALAAAGAQAVILPADDATAAAPGEAIDVLDGLVLAGGGDLEPANYGQRQHQVTVGVRPERDRLELALAREAFERDLPLLGVCRGMEVMNVARGGTLVQELERASDHLDEPGSFIEHDVALEPGTLAARAARAERLRVCSHHHQGIEALGDGLVVSGRSVPDGVVEAIEAPDRLWALGVLWHAEEQRPSPVFESLVAAALERAGVAA